MLDFRSQWIKTEFLLGWQVFILRRAFHIWNKVFLYWLGSQRNMLIIQEQMCLVFGSFLYFPGCLLKVSRWTSYRIWISVACFLLKEKWRSWSVIWCLRSWSQWLLWLAMTQLHGVWKKIFLKKENAFTVKEMMKEEWILRQSGKELLFAFFQIIIILVMLAVCFHCALNTSQSTDSVLTTCPALQQRSHLGGLGGRRVDQEWWGLQLYWRFWSLYRGSSQGKL